MKSQENRDDAVTKIERNCWELFYTIYSNCIQRIFKDPKSCRALKISKWWDHHEVGAKKLFWDHSLKLSNNEYTYKYVSSFSKFKKTTCSLFACSHSSNFSISWYYAAEKMKLYWLKKKGKVIITSQIKFFNNLQLFRLVIYRNPTGKMFLNFRTSFVRTL